MRLIKNLSEAKGFLLLGLVYTVVITILLLVPISGTSTFDFPYSDKLAHVILHFGLTFIWLCHFFLGDQYHFSSKKVLLVLSTCFFYGMIIEAFQHWFTSTRNFDFFDIIANGIGDLIGLLSFGIVMKKTVRRS